MNTISTSVKLAKLIIFISILPHDRALLFQAWGHNSEHGINGTTKSLSDAKYRPINPSIDFLINPLTKPDHDTGEVIEAVDSAYC